MNKRAKEEHRRRDSAEENESQRNSDTVREKERVINCA